MRLINQADDAACECAHEAERHEQRRRAVIEHYLVLVCSNNE